MVKQKNTINNFYFYISNTKNSNNNTEIIYNSTIIYFIKDLLKIFKLHLKCISHIMKLYVYIIYILYITCFF